MIRTLELRDNQCDFPKLQFFRILEYFLQYIPKYVISNKIWTENSHEIFQYIVMKMGDSYELFSEIIYHKKSTYFVSVKGFLYYIKKKVPLIKKFKAFLWEKFLFSFSNYFCYLVFKSIVIISCNFSKVDSTAEYNSY